MEEYLRMLAVRLFLMKELLSEDGCLWVHLDWHSVHYVKVLLDEIFGEKNFINEVIWNYKSGGVSKNYFARKHDTLLFYAKSPKYYFKAQQEKSYNRDFKPYRFKGVAEYRDEIGWYTMVNMKDVWQINMVGRTSAERTGYATQKPEQLIDRILESCTREGDLCADFFGGSGTLAAAADRMGRKWISCDIGDLSAINSHKRLVSASREGYRFLAESHRPESGGN
jgi:adenine specific DNA methylase Mod